MPRNIPNARTALVDAHEQWAEHLDGRFESEDWEDDRSGFNPVGSPLSTSLAYFCEAGDEAGLRALLDANASADVDAPGQAHEIPLLQAVWHGQLGCCEILLARGASTSSLDQGGFSALDALAARGTGRPNTRAMALLLAARGAPVDAEGTHGLTPFLLACRALNIEAAQVLLELGARLGARSSRGLDAWEVADGARGRGRRFAYCSIGSRLFGDLDEAADAFMAFLRSAYERAELDGDQPEAPPAPAPRRPSSL